MRNTLPPTGPTIIHNAQPRLQPAWCNQVSSEPSELRRIVVERGSLTARLRQCCQHFEVKVLSQGLARVSADEYLANGIRLGRLVWLREVLLRTDGNNVVYARTIICQQNLRGGWRAFTGLGNQPLGHALFANPLIRRGSLQYRHLSGNDMRAKRARAAVPEAQQRHRLMARRSLFWLAQRPLMVCEIFLPAADNLRKQKHVQR